jgi:hypothetical protein
MYNYVQVVDVRRKAQSRKHETQVADFESHHIVSPMYTFGFGVLSIAFSCEKKKKETSLCICTLIGSAGAGINCCIGVFGLVRISFDFERYGSQT